MFGWWDADEFLEEIDAVQFDKWRAFARVEPFGPWADDQRHGMAMAMQANMNRDTSKRKEPFAAQDFMTCHAGKPAKKKLPTKVLIEMMTAAIGKPNG